MANFVSPHEKLGLPKVSLPTLIILVQIDWAPGSESDSGHKEAGMYALGNNADFFIIGQTKHSTIKKIWPLAGHG